MALKQGRQAVPPSGETPSEGPLAVKGVRAINRIGGTLRRWGVPLVELEPGRLIETARSREGLTDFGGYPLEEPLDALVRALESEASLSLVGRLTARWEILHLLRNRLRLQRDWTTQPEIAREPVERPIFILGLPRSGTTLLHALLAQDPDSRFPAHWEVMHPSPPPDAAATASDPRIRRAQRELGWFYRMAPGFRAMHLMGARYPQECTEITSPTFLSLRFDSLYSVPSYRDWVDEVGLERAYAFHRRMLQHLQWRCPPRRWVLKAPDHVFGMEGLLKIYPDARIVMTHRDPLRVTPSVASLTVALQGLFSDAVDARRVARTVAGRWADGARRMVSLRSADRAPGRYLDVHYLDLVREPLAVIRDLYAKLGLALTSDTARHIEEFLARHPQGRHGRHSYNLAQFGLDAADQRRQYQDYVEFFRVAEEAPAG